MSQILKSHLTVCYTLQNHSWVQRFHCGCIMLLSNVHIPSHHFTPHGTVPHHHCKMCHQEMFLGHLGARIRFVLVKRKLISVRGVSKHPLRGHNCAGHCKYGFVCSENDPKTPVEYRLYSLCGHFPLVSCSRWEAQTLELY